MKKGVFWLIDDKLWAFLFDGSHSEGFARSGDTYNHWSCAETGLYRMKMQLKRKALKKRLKKS